MLWAYLSLSHRYLGLEQPAITELAVATVRATLSCAVISPRPRLVWVSLLGRTRGAATAQCRAQRFDQLRLQNVPAHKLGEARRRGDDGGHVHLDETVRVCVRSRPIGYAKEHSTHLQFTMAPPSHILSFSVRIRTLYTSDTMLATTPLRRNVSKRIRRPLLTPTEEP